MFIFDCKNILQFVYFYSFDQINAALWTLENMKFLLTPEFV